VAEAFRCKHRLAPFLGAGVRSAVFCEDTVLPGDIVVPGCKVSYRLDWLDATPYRLLVYPEDFREEANQISLLSPIGVALLGVHAGDGMPVFVPEQGFHTLHVVGVERPTVGADKQIAPALPVVTVRL